MSGPQEPDLTPPEVPEEFAAAYRAAYERALAAQSEQTHRAAEDDGGDVPARSGRIHIGTHRARQRDQETVPDDDLEDDAPASRSDRARRSPWFVPALLALLVLLLIIGAYAVGRVFAGRVGGGDAPSGSSSVAGGKGGSDSRGPAGPRSKPGSAKVWKGALEPVKGLVASTGCTSAPGTDAGGGRVDYAPANMVDESSETTWRCDGTAVGRTITLRLARDTAIGEVGLIPGYAKTDDQSGADRYAQNNRITKVRWTLGTTVVEQTITPDAKNRDLRLLRVPRTTARTVRLEILAVDRGPRNTTAISEVRISHAR